MMSSSIDDNENEEAEMMLCLCASCGVAEVDDIKLKKCDGCDLVRYCSDTCQQDHRPEHETKCKERAAELRDEILFRQPESTHLGDCPICCLPLLLDQKQNTFYSCCMKMVCKACEYANTEHKSNGRFIPKPSDFKCLFCRQLCPADAEELKTNLMKRVAANDPHAMSVLGGKLRDKRDYAGAFRYFTKAAEVGKADAHFNLFAMYQYGQGVDEDDERARYHLEEAAIGGHPDARYTLGFYEGGNNMNERAVKHFIIAANLGHDKSIQTLKDCYKEGLVSKEDFAAALRGHQAAVDAMKSPQRDPVAKAAAAGLFRYDGV